MSDQNIFAAVLDKVRAANSALVADGVLPAGIDQSRIVVEPPREAAHGDMATNAAMVLAKDAGRKPRELAEAIAAKLRTDAMVAKAEVAGPGFINLTLEPVAWIGALRAVLAADADYGRSNAGQGRRGQRRIRLRQPDRTHACRPLPRCGVRGRARRICWRLPASR